MIKIRQSLVKGTLFAAILVAACVVNTYNLGDHPPGLFCDEAAMGYNSYAIAEAGIGEDGEPWPLLFWSFGGYKDPVYIYPGAVVVKLLGLTVFSTRLPSALFGIGSVVVIFLLGRSLAGAWVGLWSALLLAFMPWHIHFSRIAFGVTSFAFLFLLTLYFLLEYTKGRRTLPLAAVTAALTPYAYAIATVFCSLFIAGFGLLYFPTLVRRWKESILALVVGAACIYPYVDFYQTHDRAWRYAQNARWFKIEVPESESLSEQVVSVVQQGVDQWPRYKKSYLEFFTDKFLFLSGDRITRHAVRDHGELLPLWIDTGPIEFPVVGEITTGALGLSGMKMLVFLGILVCLVVPDRRYKLIVLWFVLHPFAAAVMKEVPSATRAFVGTGSFAVLAGLGITGILQALRRLLRGGTIVAVAQGVLTATFFFWLFIPGVRHYLHLYIDEYPKYAAPTPGGFQYGYGPAIEYMDSVRDDYDLLMISTSDTNQPPIFPLFYRKLDPTGGRGPADLGYLVADPAYYGTYDMRKKILFALRRRDLHYFTDYDIKKAIVAPGGQETFLVTEVRKRKRFLTKWMTLGPFPNEKNQGIFKDFISPTDLSMKRVKNVYGTKTKWNPIRQIFVRTNLNDYYGHFGKPPPGNPERVCAYAVTTVVSPDETQAYLEISGTDVVRVWLNGAEITSGPLNLSPKAKRREIHLSKGDNPLLVQSCEEIGSWFFEARITDEDGADLGNIRSAARLGRHQPPVPPPGASEPEEGSLQLVEGFFEILGFQHSQADYPDYRGSTMSWWAYSDDADPTVSWQSAAVPSQHRTAIVFTASIGGGGSIGTLAVDGVDVLDFPVRQDSPAKTWTKGEWELRFSPRSQAGGNSGYFVLLAPESALHAGRSLELRVTLGPSNKKTWFMIKDYADTITHERLISRAILGAGGSDWATVDPDSPTAP